MTPTPSLGDPTPSVGPAPPSADPGSGSSAERACEFAIPGSGQVLLIDLSATTVQCAEARRILTLYLAAAPNVGGGTMNVQQIEGWTCMAPTAVLAAQEGVAIRCQKSGEEIVLRP